MIKYGAAKTKAEKRDAYFREQIRQLMGVMDVRNKNELGAVAGFKAGKMYRMYREPSKIKFADVEKLEKLFAAYGMRLGFDPEEECAIHG